MRTVTYAIGDVHGRLDLLTQLLGSIEQDAASRHAAAKIVFLGDYVDRGSDSRGVIDRLIAGPERAGDEFVCLRGNHDDLFVKAVTGHAGLPNWADLMFADTLASYGLRPEDWKAQDAELRRHADFLAALPTWHEDGTYVFAHAGIRPGIPMARQSDEDLMWIREDFLDHPWPLPKPVVHGHTIMGDHPVMTGNRISVDTGAFRSGILSAAVLDGKDVSFLQAIGTPDRHAIVRGVLVRATLAGSTVSPAQHEVLREYLAGSMDEPALERRLASLVPVG